MTLFQALAKAQAKFPPIEFDQEAELGQGRRYRYASLHAVLRAVKPALNELGIFVSQACTELVIDGHLVVRCVTRLYLGDQVLEEVGEKRAPDATIHKHGSAQTYLKRYQLCNMLGVVGQEDDDGHAAQPKPTAGGSKAAPPKRPRQGAATVEPEAGEGAPSSASPAGERVVDVLIKRVNSGVSKRGTQWAIGVFQTQDGEELRCGTFSKTWVDCLINEQRNTDRVWQLTLSPPKKDGDAWQIEGLKWVTESGELVDPDMADCPF
ncbi:MAG: ERF family protein [Synechococcus sp.]|nr:ERF family protein [Synechococcus sp.]